MLTPRVDYDINSHIFETLIQNGTVDPTNDIIVYDGGDLDNPTKSNKEDKEWLLEG